MVYNDLEIASQYAQQDISQQLQPTQQEQPAQPVQFAAEVEPICELEKQKEVSVKIESSETTENGSGVEEIKDTIDAAISGEIKKEEGYESSDLDLSSEDDEEESSDSSSEEEEEEEDGDSASKDKKLNKKSVLSEALDEEEEIFADGIVKTAHEIVDIVIEKPNFEVTPQTEIILAGSIFQMIGNVIVVHCRPGCEYSTLDQGSLLVYENREVMGEVFETFGPVARPYYSVRFNDAKEINTEFGTVGALVFYVPSYQKTQIVETEALKKIKGTDASNVYDEEVGEDEVEFSDDEKEMDFRKKKNREKKQRNNAKNGAPPNSGDNRPMKMRRQARPPRDAPTDFDSALAAYEGSQLPPRQQQSYADITDYHTPALLPVQQQQQQNYHQPQYQQPHYQQQQQQQHLHSSQQLPQQQQVNYQSPADLVSALFKSYNGQLPTQLTPNTQQTSAEEPKKTLKSLFSDPPPRIE